MRREKRREKVSGTNIGEIAAGLRIVCIRGAATHHRFRVSLTSTQRWLTYSTHVSTRAGILVTLHSALTG